MIKSDEEKQQILTFEKLATLNLGHFCLKNGGTEFLTLLLTCEHAAVKSLNEVKFSVPVAEMTLEGKQILVEALNGLLLQDVVDAISPIQHPYLHLRLLFSLWLRALRDFMLCDKPE